MVTSVRFEAAADEPGQVKSYFDELFRRCGLGLGKVTDEHYERAPEGLGYTGRVKVVYEVPMHAAMEQAWFRGEDPYSVEGVGDFVLTYGMPVTASEDAILDNIMRIEGMRGVSVQSEVGEPRRWIVNVEFKDGKGFSVSEELPLREVLLAAYARCGTPVTEYRTTG